MSSRLKLQITRYGRYAMILLVLMIAGTAAGFWILLQQRLPNPFQTVYNVNAVFPTVDAVQPGLGEPVQVAGVRVGEITGTSLQNGLGVIHMAIFPDQLPHIYRNASAVLIPNSPLKDMEVDMSPGTRTAGRAPNNFTIPISQTTSPIDSDDLLDALDADTRQWFSGLVADFGTGLKGRGPDLHALLVALGPTTAQLRQIGDLLAVRRHELAALTHNLGLVTAAVNVKDAQLRQVVDAGDATFNALAGQDTALRQAVARLPGTLATTRATLSSLTGLADALRPTATALIPTAQRLPTTLRDTETLFQGSLLLPLKQIPPFVKASLPLASQLPPIISDLKQATPALTSSFKVLGAVANELAFDPGGGNPGFLYWLPWSVHDVNSFVSSGDADGSAWRVLTLLSCADLTSDSVVSTLLPDLLGSGLSSTLGCGP
jgi:phospholipid/cholesterol/gamma-HCH transport system substrate-binding protein